MSTSFEDIGVVLQDYFDALYFCDVEKLQRVFHPAAIYATADETPFLHRSMAEYVPVVAAAVPRLPQRGPAQSHRFHRVRGRQHRFCARALFDRAA